MHFGSILTEDLNKLKIEESENLMRESNPEKENFYSLQNGLKEVQLPHHKCLKLMVLGQAHCEKEKFVNFLCFQHLKKKEENTDLRSNTFKKTGFTT
jgi:septin family protein